MASLAPGGVAGAFGRTSAAPAQDSVRLLSALQRELDKPHPSWHTVAQLCQSLAEVGTTEQGWHQLASEAQVPALRELLDRCTHRLADMPASHASHDSLSQACERLRPARLHHSVARLAARPSALARALPALLPLTHLAPAPPVA
ncbi:restriction endonuclease, partial [Pseudomonas syringae]